MYGVQDSPVEGEGGYHERDWRYWCAGGYPIQAYRAMGGYDVKSPNCNIDKALFPRVLRLKGLQLLKSAGRRGEQAM